MNMAGYTKLFNSILASTIWRSDDKTRIVWITLLAMADKDGIAEGSVPGLADLARVSIEDCEAALAELMAPDKYSRTTEYEGRRIEPVDGGWLLLNHAKYRAKMSEDDIREKNRQRQAKWREKHKSNASSNAESQDVTLSNAESRQSRHTEADTKAKAETKEQEKKKSIAQDSDSHSRKDSDHVIDSSSSPKENKGSAVDWFEALKKEEIYSHIDFDAEARKAQMWLDDKAPTRKFTKRYFVNWIGRIEKPLTVAPAPSYNHVKGQPTQREAIEAEQKMIAEMEREAIEAEQKMIELMEVQ